MTKMFNPILFLSFLFLLLSAGLQAQNIVISQNGNVYRFDVAPAFIAEDDLVYYRFSDGTHLKAIAQKGNTGQMTAMVNRSFRSEGGNVGVIAYVAKKGGPLGLIGSTTTTIAPCPTCENPTILSTQEMVKLEGSWGLFTDGEALEGMLDDIVHPHFTTPEIPWILLNAAIRSTESTTPETLELNIPIDFYIQNVIVEDETGFNSFTPVGCSFCEDVVIEDNTVIVNLKETFSGTANVYVLIAGYPTVLESHLFTATVSDKEGVLASDLLALNAAHNPHDPNTLIAYEPEFCSNQSQPDVLTFRTNFQNMGAGPVEDVQVVIDSDAAFMDLNSLQVLESSHTVTSVSTVGSKVILTFTGINLPGLLQEYPYPQILPVEKTKGWVVFSIAMLPCVKVNAEIISHTGAVIFDCPGCGPNGYQEVTPLNEVLHKNSNCSPDPACVLEIPSPISVESPNAGNPFLPDLPFSIQAYPTSPSETLYIALENIEATQRVFVRLVDLNGQTWYEAEQPAGDRFARWTVQTATMPAGIYFLQVQQNDQLQVRKVIKQ